MESISNACIIRTKGSLNTLMHLCCSDHLVWHRLGMFGINTSTFPQCWKHAHLQPIPKKGSRSDPSNYRPIALTSILSKIFETLLNSHFLDHLESHSLLSDRQYGFWRSRSTGDILSYLTDLWFSALRNYGETCVVALDISKAFDRVWHASLP